MAYFFNCDIFNRTALSTCIVLEKEHDSLVTHVWIGASLGVRARGIAHGGLNLFFLYERSILIQSKLRH